MNKDLLWPGICILLVIGLYAFLAPGHSSWDGQGSINVFPVDASAKNYRLDSNSISVSVKKRGWFHKEYSYSISSADWPDGGEIDFNQSCKISYPATSATCKSNEGTVRVEIASAPDEPDSSGYDTGN